MLPYRFSERASRDLDRLREWYDRTDVTLADRAVDAVFDVIRDVRERPESFPEIDRGVRASRCRRFPYRIYFVVTAEGINVLAVYHTSRDPDGWDDPERE